MPRGFLLSNKPVIDKYVKVITGVKEHLIQEEGYKTKMYICPAGKPTIGVGHNLENPIPEKAVEVILDYDIGIAMAAAKKILNPEWPTMPELVQIGILSMIFQLGETRFREFKKTISLLKEKKYKEAAVEAFDSKWARIDSPARAYRVVQLIASGTT